MYPTPPPQDVWEAGTGELLRDRDTRDLLDRVLGPDANQLGEHFFAAMRKAEP